MKSPFLPALAMVALLAVGPAVAQSAVDTVTKAATDVATQAATDAVNKTLTPAAAEDDAAGDRRKDKKDKKEKKEKKEKKAPNWGSSLEHRQDGDKRKSRK